MKDLVTSNKNKPFSNILEFLSKNVNDLLIICPYIQSSILDKLLNNCNAKKITIITSWKVQDILLGSSDIKLYNLCKSKGIFLYINNRVHLKALIKDYKTCIFGSANISVNGLGLGDNYNYELFSMETYIDSEEIFYFKKILNESLLVDDKVYNFYKDKIRDLEKISPIEEIDLNEISSDKDFLISALPMSKNVEKLYKIYSKNFKSGTKEEVECAIHDTVLYDLPLKLNKDEFLALLKKKFFESKFIAKFLRVIEGDGMYFGRVKEWIQNNCTDVPIPSRRSLTGNIQALYKWVVELSEGLYRWDVPEKHSQRIYRV